MTFIRPEALAALSRWRELIAAGGAGAGGLWLLAQGGVLPTALGAVAVAAAAGLGLTALRRLRFAAGSGALAAGPGAVEVVEGQISWFGPGIGGSAAIDDLAALSVVTVAGIRCWRLDQADGRHLLIPLAAAGADRLFDAFSVLPGMDGGLLLAAVGRREGAVMVWRRSRPASARLR